MCKYKNMIIINIFWILNQVTILRMVCANVMRKTSSFVYLPAWPDIRHIFFIFDNQKQLSWMWNSVFPIGILWKYWYCNTTVLFYTTRFYIFFFFLILNIIFHRTRSNAIIIWMLETLENIALRNSYNRHNV